MANQFIHGKLGTISFQGVFFAALQYDFEESTTLDDITYTQVGGATFATKIPGYNMATGTITFVYDTLNKPVLSPQYFVPGNAGTAAALILYPSGSDPYTFTVWTGRLRIPSGPKTGPVICTTNWESTNSYTRPLS